MTETLLGLVPTFGPLAVFAATLLGCFGFPVPGSLVLLAAGSFVASGEMALAAVLFGGLAGAIIGDQAGYWLGAYGGDAIVQRLSRRHQFAAGLGAARAFTPSLGQTRRLLQPVAGRPSRPAGQPDYRIVRHVLAGIQPNRGTGRSGLGLRICRAWVRLRREHYRDLRAAGRSHLVPRGRSRRYRLIFVRRVTEPGRPLKTIIANTSPR